MKEWKAELSLSIVTLVWGATFLFTKVGLDDCTPSTFIIIRFLIALVLTLVFYNRKLLNIKRDALINGAILGLLFGCGFVLQTYGLKYTSVSKSAFITAMTVPITPFVFKLFNRAKISTWSKIGVSIATIGLYIFTNPNFEEVNLGDVMTLLSTIFWAFYITFLDKATKGRSEKNLTAHLVASQYLFALIPALITFFLFDLSDFKFNLTSSLFIALAFNGILASFLVTIIQTAVQRYTTPIKATLIFSFEPIIANIIAVIVISEILSIREYIGAVVLFGGLLSSEIGPFISHKLIRR